MEERRLIRGVTVADFSGPYIRMLPWWAVEKPWYMMGDHGPYSPVIFR